MEGGDGPIRCVKTQENGKLAQDAVMAFCPIVVRYEALECNRWLNR
ncbi:MAG: hypothetical protein KatS3mg004_2714 [Bryobacteraceae bacterium]|nr:MAG: hypothetical protein KatS3mg004_2714 [Bryobacteraceae bacterium]